MTILIFLVIRGLLESPVSYELSKFEIQAIPVP